MDLSENFKDTGIDFVCDPEFRCVMDQGGGTGFYLYSQFMPDGDVLEIELGTEPYQSKIRFKQIFMEKKGDIGELHHQMIK